MAADADGMESLAFRAVWTTVDGAWRSTDQKVRGSSPSGRATHIPRSTWGRSPSIRSDSRSMASRCMVVSVWRFPAAVAASTRRRRVLPRGDRLIRSACRPRRPTCPARSIYRRSVGRCTSRGNDPLTTRIRTARSPRIRVSDRVIALIGGGALPAAGWSVRTADLTRRHCVSRLTFSRWRADRSL